MTFIVGISTCGRPEILAETLMVLESQTRLPDQVIICPAKQSDLPSDSLENLRFPVRVVEGPAGLPSQRNAIMQRCKDDRLLLFIDDDFFLSADYIARCENLFENHPSVVAATGRVLADGVVGPGLPVSDALQQLAKAQGSSCEELTPRPVYTAYGCNMAFRLSTIRENDLCFDERLPLYAWQEDVDFSRQLAPFGDIVLDETLRGIHLGHKSGRTSGMRLGYSQVMNPTYLWRKGTLSFSFASRLMLRNCLMNLAKCMFPEPYVDRRGRLRGNLMAAMHLMRGKIEPEFILKL